MAGPGALSAGVLDIYQCTAKLRMISVASVLILMQLTLAHTGLLPSLLPTVLPLHQNISTTRPRHIEVEMPLLPQTGSQCVARLYE